MISWQHFQMFCGSQLRCSKSNNHSSVVSCARSSHFRFVTGTYSRPVKVMFTVLLNWMVLSLSSFFVSLWKIPELLPKGTDNKVTDKYVICWSIKRFQRVCIAWKMFLILEWNRSVLSCDYVVENSPKSLISSSNSNSPLSTSSQSRFQSRAAPPSSGYIWNIPAFFKTHPPQCNAIVSNTEHNIVLMLLLW